MYAPPSLLLLGLQAGQGEVSTGGVPAVPAEGVYAPPPLLLGLQAGQGEVTPSQQGVRLLAY